MPNERPAGTNAIVRAVQSPPVHEHSRWLKVAALALGMTLAAGAVQWSAAQRRDAPPRIIVATTILAEPDSQATLVIEVAHREALPSNSFVRLRGFPRSISLTEGHAIAPGAWAVPLFALGSLKAIVPAGVSGRTEIVISLVGVDGTTLAEEKTALVVAPASVLASPIEKPPADPPPKRLVPIPAPSPAARPPRRPEFSAEERARAEWLLDKGERSLRDGNIGAARGWFERAADAGLAAGALKLAATYDPEELARRDVRVTPDAKEARKWYERARELGAPEADERLARLSP